MGTTLKARGVELAELNAEVQNVLTAVDRGEYDAELFAAGVTRDNAVGLAHTVTLTAPQGLSPSQWAEILVSFSPFADEVCKTIWELLVVPALKHRFREDRIKTDGDSE